MQATQVSILDGSTFVVSDPRGDIDARPDEPAGFFHRDMRHLSRWQLRLDGRVPDVLSGVATASDEAMFFLVEPTGSIYRNPAVALIRRRQVGDGMREQLQLDNHGAEALRCEIVIRFDADFADIFEIKDDLTKAGRRTHRIEPGSGAAHDFVQPTGGRHAVEVHPLERVVGPALNLPGEEVAGEEDDGRSGQGRHDRADLLGTDEEALPEFVHRHTSSTSFPVCSPRRMRSYAVAPSASGTTRSTTGQSRP